VFGTRYKGPVRGLVRWLFPLLLLGLVIQGPTMGLVKEATTDIGNSGPGTIDELSLGADPAFWIEGDTEFLSKAASDGWSGSGSPTDPYVIEGYTFNYTKFSYAIWIVDVSYHFIVRGNRFEGGNETTWAYSKALYLVNVTCEVVDNWFTPRSQRDLHYEDSHLIVRNNTFGAYSYNIYGVRSRSSIEMNTFNGTGNDAVYLYEGSGDIDGNTIVGGRSPRGGIHLSGVSAFNVTRNDISGFQYGIFRSLSTAVSTGTVRDNVISNCTSGIWIWRMESVSILNNTISPKGDGDLLERGIYAFENLYMDCRNNSLFRCGFYISVSTDMWDDQHIDSTNTIDSIPIAFLRNRSDIDLDGTYSEYILVNCTNVTMIDRTIRSPFFGIMMASVRNLEMTGCTIDTGVQNFLFLRQMFYSNITLNPLLNNTRVVVNMGSRSEFSNNTINNGSLSCSGSYVVMTNNTLQNTTVSNAISVGGTRYLDVSNNTIFFEEGLDYTSGFYISSGGWSSSHHHTIKGNELWGGGGFLFENIDLSDLVTYDIDDTNMVNGRPLAFRSDEADFALGTGYGQVVMAGCINATIDGLYLNRSTYGVQLFGCTNVTVSNCTFNDTMNYAVSCDNIRESSFIDNTITGGEAWIIIKESRDLRIERNVVKDIALGEPAGSGRLFYFLNCDGIVFDRNVIDNADCNGVILYRTDSCTFTNNTFKNCTGFAIDIGSYSGGSLFYLNTFIGNNPQEYPNGTVYYVQCDSYYDSNKWDNGSLGNYWSDYQSRYPSATNDGYVWDLPYRYNYPLNMLLDTHPLAVPYDHTLPVIGPMVDVYIIQQGTASFKANATDDVGIVGYTWTFDLDGHPVVLDGENQSFQFNEAGEVEVWLVVWDHWNNTARGNLTVHVRDIEPPVISGVGDVTVLQDTLVTFNSSGCKDNVGIQDVAWSFIYDGGQVDLRTPVATHLFEVPGIYEVTLNVSDLAGNWASTTFTVTVIDTEPPFARLGKTVEVGQGTTLRFSGLNSTDNVGIVGYEWRMTSDVMPDIDREGIEFVHTFTLVGEYLLTLVVSDAAGNRGIDFVKVTVLDTELPVAMAGADITVEPGTEVSLDGSGSTDNVGIVEWSWHFTYDGLLREFSTSSFTFLFDIEGSYVVDLTVRDARGNEGSAQVLVLVQDTVMPVAVAGEDLSVDQHQSITFDGSRSSDDRAVVVWLWTFEHGGAQEELEGVSPSFVFNEAGTYLVTLTVADAAGNSAMDTLPVEVRDITSPLADAGPDVTVDQHQAVAFDGTASSDNVGLVDLKWLLEYEGGQRVLEGLTPEFTFDVVGEYQVTLEVLDAEGNLGSDIMMVTVMDVDPPIVVAGEDLTIQEGHTATFDASNSTDNVGIISWNWTFTYQGTLQELPGETATFTLRKAGEYNVTLTVIDARGNIGTDTLVVRVMSGPLDPEKEDGFSIVVAVIILAVVLVAVLMAVVVMRKRGSGTE